MEFVYASLAVIVFTFLHMLGVLLGKITQDILTLVKIISLSAILIAGFAYSQSSPDEWQLALPENKSVEGTGGAETGKEFTFHNDAWEVGLTLTTDKKGDKLVGKFKNLKNDPQKLNLKLLVRTSKDNEIAPDVIGVEKDYPVIPSTDAVKTVTVDLPSREKPRTGIYEVEQVVQPPMSLGWGALAMILVLYAFGGWNDAAFVASEVRNPQRNIPRALIIGVSLITVAYLLINTAYLMGLGFEGAKKWGVPSNLLERAVVDGLGKDWEGWGEKSMSILIVISALGAVSGLIFTGARVYATLGNDYSLFGWMGHWQPGKRAPILALLVQAVFTLGMIFMLGTKTGHEIINNLLSSIQIQHKSQWGPGTAFETLVDHTAPVFWTFFLLTGISLFVLRARDIGIVRPFSVPLYPWLPLIFCNTCAFMLYQSAVYVGWRALFAFGLVLLGIPFYWLACAFGGYRGDVPKQ
jgi:amino acid transporter